MANGAPNTNRTCDPLLRRKMLYPLSYGGQHATIAAREDLRQASARRRQTSNCWDVPNGFKQAMVVEPRCPFERGELHCFLYFPEQRTAIDSLGLVESIDGLGQGVVVAVVFAAYRRIETDFSTTLHRITPRSPSLHISRSTVQRRPPLRLRDPVAAVSCQRRRPAYKSVVEFRL